jgi:hypothetical protein
MNVLDEGGVLAMIEPSGFLYNRMRFHSDAPFSVVGGRAKSSTSFRFAASFKKGNADPMGVVVVIAEAGKPSPDSRLLLACSSQWSGHRRARLRYRLLRPALAVYEEA